MGQRPQQLGQRPARGDVGVGLDRDRTGGEDQPEQILGPLGVPTEPEEVVEYARHHGRRRAVEQRRHRVAFDPGPARRRRPDRGRRVLADHPDVLRHPGAGCGDEHPAALVGVVADPGQAAQHRRVRAPLPHRERAQHDVPLDQPLLLRRRSDGQVQHLLTDEAVRGRRDLGPQPNPLLGVNADARTLRPWSRLIGRITRS